MDVLVLTSLYPPHSYGGYEASCRDVVERWRQRRHAVTVLTTDTRVSGVEQGSEDAGVRRELAFYWVDHTLPDRSWRDRARLERANRAALRRTLAEVRPQLVSAWSMGALSLGLLEEVAAAGLPLVLVVCDDWLVYGERADLWRRGLTGPIRRRVAAGLTGLRTGWPGPDAAVRVVWVSRTVRDRARREAPWFPGEGAVIGSGIDRTDFPECEPRPGAPWSWRLLQVGRLDPRKGIETSVRALAQLPPEAGLDVVGRGDDSHQRHLEAVAAELGVRDRVRFAARPRSELAEVYAAADVVLFPPVWEEPFGLVPLEAMACATPVIATGTGGSAEFLVDGVNCQLIPPGDPDALAAAVRRLAGDPGLRARLVAGGLATAREHDVDRYAEQLEAEHLAALHGPDG